jgi:hypothetical protein
MPVVNTVGKSGFVDDGATSGCRMRSKKVTRERENWLLKLKGVVKDPI